MDIYQDYALNEAKMEELEAKQKALKVQIIEDMVSRGLKNSKTELGTFTIATLKEWTYSPTLVEVEKKVKAQVKELTEDLKGMKAQEEETELASCVESPSLRFKLLAL
jgi:hypothetical protein